MGNLVKCLECNRDIISKHSKKFCTRSCSAKFNNRGRRRWFKEHNFCKCGKRKSHSRNKECLECKILYFGEKTLQEVIHKGKQFHSRIRTHARLTLKRAKVHRKCRFCNTSEFERILEVCHIRAVSDFPQESKVKEINHVDNLEYLCPNHHKMVDKGYLK